VITDVLAVALTIMAEAGGEPYAGKVMVGETIAYNHIISGKSLAEVCLAKKKFSCWNWGYKILLKKLHKQKAFDQPEWKDCMKVARAIHAPAYKPISSVTHFLNPKLAPDTFKRWKKKMQLVAVVGNHVFFREKVNE